MSYGIRGWSRGVSLSDEYAVVTPDCSIANPHALVSQFNPCMGIAPSRHVVAATSTLLVAGLCEGDREAAFVEGSQGCAWTSGVSGGSGTPNVPVPGWTADDGPLPTLLGLGRLMAWFTSQIWIDACGRPHPHSGRRSWSCMATPWRTPASVSLEVQTCGSD